tara:strand:- start:846 stop:1328 length:483 start_codon:yes stop_codon:yes gene_type:complete
MKRNNFLLIIFCLASLISCKPDDPKSIGPKYDTSEGISGSWEIHSLEVVDETLPVPETRDISDYFITQNSKLGISFNVEDNSYTVDNAQEPANPFGSTGLYSFDDPDYPSQMTLFSSTQDTVVLHLNNIVRSIDPYMGYKIKKEACGGLYASYIYTFRRL